MLCFVEFSKPISDYCEAKSYSFGFHPSSSPYAGGARNNAQLHNVYFTKGRDSLSGGFMQACAAGTRFADVSIELYRDADSDVYMVYALKDVIIASFNSSAKGEESVGLDYKTMKQSYFG